MHGGVRSGVEPALDRAPTTDPASGQFRFATMVALGMSAVTLVVAWVYDLPVRDPDHSVAGPTWLRLPLILSLAFLLDVLPRSAVRAWRHGELRHVGAVVGEVVRDRWTLPHVKFALVGLGTWYLTYASFRNLKSFVPFVNRHLWDSTLAEADRLLFFGHDPVDVVHAVFGTGAAPFFSFLYIAWIVFVPASLAIALVWSRNSVAGAWYVTAVAVDWVLGVATYFVVPSLGPVYAHPSLFTSLPHTDVTSLQQSMMADRHEVLVNPFTTEAVQTIAAFASLHVGICVTMCVMAELLRLHRAVRVFLWLFLALTVPCTVYLGWHYAVDTLGGAVLGVAGVWIAGKGTGNAFRRRPVGQELVAGTVDASGGASAARSRAA